MHAALGLRTTPEHDAGKSAPAMEPARRIGVEVDSGAPSGMPAFLAAGTGSNPQKERNSHAARSNGRSTPIGSPAAAVDRDHGDVFRHMESAFGIPFAGVELRTDEPAAERAASLNARAYTDGREIGFARGAFAPKSPDGLHTIAHEFAHVAQMRGGTGGELGRGGTGSGLQRAALSVGSGGALAQSTIPTAVDVVEADADAAADAIAEGRRPEVADLSDTGVPFDLLLEDKKPKKPTKKVTRPASQAQGTYRVKKEGPGSYSYTFNSADVVAASNPILMVFQRHFRNNFPSADEFVEMSCISGLKGLRLIYDDATDSFEQLRERAKKSDTYAFIVMPDVHQDMLGVMKRLFPEFRPAIPLEATHRLSKEGTGGGGAGTSTTAQATPGAGQPGTVETVNQRSVQLPPDLKGEEKDRILKVLELLVAPPDSKAQPAQQKQGIVYVSKEAAKMLLTFAGDPTLRERLRSAPRAEGSGQTLEQMLETILANVESEKMREELGLEAPTGEREEKPIEDRPVRGQIINRTGKLVPEQEAEFVFEVQDDRDAFRVPMLHIHWYSFPRGNPQDLVDDETTFYNPLRSPGFLNDNVFNVTFEEPGLYDVTALVSHNFFRPASFRLKDGVEVVTETEQAGRENKEALEGFTADAGKTTPHIFTPNEGVIDKAITLAGGSYMAGLLPGTVTRGQRDPNAVIRTVEDQLKKAGDDEQNVKDLIKAYKGIKTSDAEAVVKWGESYLETLKATSASLQDKKERGGIPLGVRGVFVSREPNVRTGPLDLLCYFFRKDKGYQVVLRDFTQLAEQKDYRFQATENKVEKAEEEVFNTQAGSYPFGTLSITFQGYDEVAGKPSGSYVRFERQTDTFAKKVKSVVFGTAASIIVNLAAVVLMLIPGLQPLGLALAIAYNTASTVSQLEEKAKKGILKDGDLLVGVGEIALNLIPLAGRFTKLLTIGSKAYYVVEGINVAGNILLVTAQGMMQVEELRNGVVARLAKVEEEIRNLQRTNAASPRLSELMTQRTALIAEGKDATFTVFQQLFTSQAFMMLGQQVIHGYMSRKFSVGEMQSQGTFRHEADAKAHYDFKEGIIVGDQAKISPAELDVLQFKHQQNKALEGLVPDLAQRQQVVDELSAHGVEVRSGASKTGLKQEGGKHVLEVGEGATVADIVDQVSKVKTLPTPPIKKKTPPASKDAPLKEDQFKPVEPLKPTTTETEAVVKSDLPADPAAYEAAGEAEAQIETQARAAYKAAASEWGYGKGATPKNEQGFIDKYKQGFVYVFDKKNPRWEKLPENRRRARLAPAPLPVGTSSHMIKTLLTGEGSTSTFKKYYKMLEAEGLADDTKLLSKIDEVRAEYYLDTKATTIDKVRHALKEKFRPDVVKRMFEAPDGTKLDPAASHKKMLEITGKLNSADKGTLTEEWVHKTREAAGVTDAPRQVTVKKSDHPQMSEDRRIDRIEGETVNEIKSTDDHLTPKDKAQMSDHLKLVGKDGATIDIDGTPHQVKKVKVTMTSPEGAIKNADYLVKQLKDNDALSVEVFNKAGESRTFNMETANELHTFLGK